MYWNEVAVSTDELTQKFAAESALEPQHELRIRADLNTRYEVLAQGMSSAKAAGLKRLAFIPRAGSDKETEISTPVSLLRHGQSTRRYITITTDETSERKDVGR